MTKPAFSKISDAKRRRVLDAAAAEFARLGLHKANINTIAERAGVSIGAMYNYFESKEDLFLAAVESGMEMLAQGFAAGFAAGGDAFELLDRVFVNAVELSRDKGDYIMLYHNLASAGMDELAARAVPSFERTGAHAFHRIIDMGVKQGLMDPDLDREAAAFALDNHFMIFLAAMASNLHRIRLREFLGVECGGKGDNEETAELEHAARRITAHLKRGLSPRG